MITTFKNKKISGMLGILPENEYDYDEETKDFASIQTRRLKKIMGFGKRRAAKETTTTCDLLLEGMKYILDKKYITQDEIGAIIVVSLTPDYFLPQISNIIQGECGFSKDVVCMDIPQGCSAFLLGFMQACLLLEHMPNKKALVLTGDVLCRKSPDRKEYTGNFGGDAGSITIVENDINSKDIPFSIKMDGSKREALIIPAGGFRMPSTDETAERKDRGNGEIKSLNEVHMDGSAVFNFVQREVPPMINELLNYGNYKKEDIEYYLFHQPNKFMLQKLADKMGVLYEKMPMNIVENFGNSSGSTVPINIVYNLGDKLLENNYKCCLSGFGSGLTWASMIIDLGNFKFCEMLETKL